MNRLYSQQAHERMLNSVIVRENKNQNHSEIPPHTSQNGYYQNNNKYQWGCREKGTLELYWWECKLV